MGMLDYAIFPATHCFSGDAFLILKSRHKSLSICTSAENRIGIGSLS